MRLSRLPPNPALIAESSSGGFLREWSIEGSCTEQGRVRLERLREGSTISTIFSSTAIRLDDPSFAISDNRIVKGRTARRGKSTTRPREQEWSAGVRVSSGGDADFSRAATIR